MIWSKDYFFLLATILVTRYVWDVFEILKNFLIKHLFGLDKQFYFADHFLPVSRHFGGDQGLMYVDFSFY